MSFSNFSFLAVYDKLKLWIVHEDNRGPTITVHQNPRKSGEFYNTHYETFWYFNSWIWEYIYNSKHVPQIQRLKHQGCIIESAHKSFANFENPILLFFFFPNLFSLVLAYFKTSLLSARWLVWLQHADSLSFKAFETSSIYAFFFLYFSVRIVFNNVLNRKIPALSLTRSKIRNNDIPFRPS